MDPEPLCKSTSATASPKNQTMAQPPSTDEASTKSDEPCSLSRDVISSPVSGVTPESTSHLHNSSLTRSPSVQVMERGEDVQIDVKRIPSYVFAGKHSNSVEWSTASYESLFSIQINNHSMFLDQADILATDVIRPGELVTSGDLTNFRRSSTEGSDQADSLSTEESQSGDMMRFSGSSTTADEERGKETINANVVTPSRLHEPHKVVRWNSPVQHFAEKRAPPEGYNLELSPLTNHQSSKTSNQSFAHSKKKSNWSLCSTSPKCCSCKWPKYSCCSCKWPKYSCCRCKFPSCSCCCGNGCSPFTCCKPKRIFCSPHSIEIKAPAKGVANKKVDIELQKPASKKWCWFIPRFSCAGSWSWSCHCC